jgi:hypothetical protein
MKALRESRGIALINFLTSALGGCEGSASRPGRNLPPGKTRYLLYRRVSEPQVRSGQVRKISHPPVFLVLKLSISMSLLPLHQFYCLQAAYRSVLCLCGCVVWSNDCFNVSVSLEDRCRFSRCLPIMSLTA